MSMQLKDIIKALKITRTEETLKVTDEVLFEQAVKIYLSEKINESKKENIKAINNKKEFKEMFGQNKNPATQKQIDLLYKLDVGFDAKKITKQEAKELIRKTLELNKKGVKNAKRDF